MRRTALTAAILLILSTQALATPASPRAGWRPVAAKLATGARRLAIGLEVGVLHFIQPRNTTAFKVLPKPPTLHDAAWNVTETIRVRLNKMHPRRPYTSWVDRGHLMRGSQLTPEGLAQLRDQGVKTVVNLRRESNGEKAMVEKLGMRAVWLPVYDQGVPSHAEVRAFLHLTLDPKNQPVYVHCEAGVGRTGVFSAVYRIAHDGYTADQAVAEARSMRMSSDAQEQFIRSFAHDWQGGLYGQVPAQ
jgi:protein-tyrosine phosphatase